jgi:hypothetical protein
LPATGGQHLLSNRNFQQTVRENTLEGYFQPLNTPEAAAVGGLAHQPPTPKDFYIMSSHHPAYFPTPPLRPSPLLLESFCLLPGKAGRSCWPKLGENTGAREYARANVADGLLRQIISITHFRLHNVLAIDLKGNVALWFSGIHCDLLISQHRTAFLPWFGGCPMPTDR